MAGVLERGEIYAHLAEVIPIFVPLSTLVGIAANYAIAGELENLITADGQKIGDNRSVNEPFEARQMYLNWARVLRL